MAQDTTNKKSWSQLMAANGLSARCNDQNSWSQDNGMRYNNKKSWPWLMTANGLSARCNNQNRWLGAIAANGFTRAKIWKAPRDGRKWLSASKIDNALMPSAMAVNGPARTKREVLRRVGSNGLSTISNNQNWCPLWRNDSKWPSASIDNHLPSAI